MNDSMAVSVTENARVVPISAAMRRRAILSSSIGNAFEWFDFLIYGFFTAAISHNFFPAHDPVVSMLLATATFAAGFVVRPIGGVVLGIYADRFGRRPALILIVELMALSALMIALTPSYASIGLWAPVLIIFARIVQGISVGGEFSSATAMLAEYAPAGRKNVYGSLQMCSQAFGMAFAAGIAFAVNYWLPAAQAESWGWRIPFALGTVVGPLGLYILNNVSESPEFTRAARDHGTDMPLLPLLKRHWRDVVAGFGVVAIGAVTNYVWFIYLPLFVNQRLHLPASTGLLSSTLCGLLLIFLCPLTGWLADRFGARRVFLTGVLCFGLSAYPLLLHVMAAPSFGRLLQTQMLCTLVIGMIWGPQPGMLASFFPVEVRSTGLSISYNLGVLLFGGIAPLVITWLISRTGLGEVPAYYTIFATLVCVGTQFVRRQILYR